MDLTYASSCRVRGTRNIAPLLTVLSCCLAAHLLTKKKPPVHHVNLNTASSAELQQVPGIGSSTADKILQMRKSYGLYKSANDLLAIRGIGQKRLEKMRKYLTVRKSQQGNTNSSKKTQATSATPPAKLPPAKAALSKPVTPPKSPPAKKTAEQEEEP